LYGTYIDLVGRNTTSKRLMHSVVMSLVRSSPVIRSEGVGG
jgi:hypothetical protein